MDPRVDAQPPPANRPDNPDWAAVIASRSSSPQQPAPSNGPAVEATPQTIGGAQDALLNEEAANMRHNRGLREKYADKAYKLATGCITIWAVLLGTQGAIKALTGVEMWSDKVIIAVTTGVTVSVLAAFLGVIRGLFGNGKDKK